MKILILFFFLFFSHQIYAESAYQKYCATDVLTNKIVCSDANLYKNNTIQNTESSQITNIQSKALSPFSNSFLKLNELTSNIFAAVYLIAKIVLSAIVAILFLVYFIRTIKELFFNYEINKVTRQNILASQNEQLLDNNFQDVITANELEEIQLSITKEKEDDAFLTYCSSEYYTDLPADLPPCPDFDYQSDFSDYQPDFSDFEYEY